MTTSDKMGGALPEDYDARRGAIYEPLRAEGVFDWDIMEDEEYALADCLEIVRPFRDELAEATEAMGRVFARTVEVLQAGEDELLLGLGLPPQTLEAARLPAPGGMLTAVGRFDFARTPEGLKMLEFNSDTPTGVVEAAYVNGVVCRRFGLRDPNAGMDLDIRDAFSALLDAYGIAGEPDGPGAGATEARDGTRAEDDAAAALDGARAEDGAAAEPGIIAFSALGWHDEDSGTARYLLQRSGLDGRFVPLADLRVDGERLLALLGDELVPVRLLYRLHPLEKLAEDRDDDGYPSGEHLLALIARGRVRLINPPSAFAAQSKALQAVIWGLHEEQQFFTREEHDWIERFMLPTYLENRFSGRCPYAVKPVFGREGGGVSLHEADGRLWLEDGERRYRDQTLVYQQFAELERITVRTGNGPFSGHLLWGSFWIGGRASGVIARVGGRITGNLAYFLPVGLGGRGDTFVGGTRP